MPNGALSNYIITIIKKNPLYGYNNQITIHNNLDILRNYVVCDVEDKLMMEKILCDDAPTRNIAKET